MRGRQVLSCCVEAARIINNTSGRPDALVDFRTAPCRHDELARERLLRGRRLLRGVVRHGFDLCVASTASSCRGVPGPRARPDPGYGPTSTTRQRAGFRGHHVSATGCRVDEGVQTSSDRPVARPRPSYKAFCQSWRASDTHTSKWARESQIGQSAGPGHLAAVKNHGQPAQEVREATRAGAVAQDVCRMQRSHSTTTAPTPPPRRSSPPY